jgi:hypothetical protein
MFPYCDCGHLLHEHASSPADSHRCRITNWSGVYCNCYGYRNTKPNPAADKDANVATAASSSDVRAGQDVPPGSDAPDAGRKP